MMRPEDEARIREIYENLYLCKKMGVRYMLSKEDYEFAIGLSKHESTHIAQIRDEISGRIFDEQTR